MLRHAAKLLRSPLLAAALLVPALSAPAAAALKPGERIGNWIVANPDFGTAYRGCAISASYRNGMAFGIDLAEGRGFYITIRSKRWTIGRNERMTVLYWINNDEPIRAAARGHGDHGLRIAIHDNDWIVRDLASAYQVTIAIGEQTYRFPITHARRAVDWIKHCDTETALKQVRVQGAAASALAERANSASGSDDSDVKAESAPPRWLQRRISVSGGGGFGAGRDGLAGTHVGEEHDLRTFEAVERPRGSEAIEILTAILKRTGVADYDLDVIDAKHRWGIAVNAVWTAPDISGALRRYNSLTGDLFTLETRRLISGDERRCEKGAFTAETLSLPINRARAFETQCADGLNSWRRNHYFLPAADGQTVLLSTEVFDAESRSVLPTMLAEAAARFALYPPANARR